MQGVLCAIRLTHCWTFHHLTTSKYEEQSIGRQSMPKSSYPVLLPIFFQSWVNISLATPHPSICFGCHSEPLLRLSSGRISSSLTKLFSTSTFAACILLTQLQSVFWLNWSEVCQVQLCHNVVQLIRPTIWLQVYWSRRVSLYALHA